MINVFEPSLGQEEIDAVTKVFESRWIGKGESVREFERLFAEHLRVPASNMLSTTCCTEGIFLSGELFGFSPGDEIIVPSISFIAVGNSVVSRGASLVLCDVDPRSLNATAEHIEKKISSRTRAVFITHYGGVPCDMEPIVDLCRRKNLLLIEDSACAPKSFYKGRACGTFGDMGLWSFDAMKIACAGDAGMIYLKSDQTTEAAREQLYYGLPNKQKSGMDSSTSGSQNWWEFEVTRPGRRAILNNIAGAIGASQLRKLDGFIARRKVVFDSYWNGLKDCGWLRLPPPLEETVQSSYYFFWVQLRQRDELARFLLEKGVYTTFRYWPLHKIEYFKSSGEDLPNSEFASGHTLNIPLHQALSDADVAKIVALIREFGATRKVAELEATR